MRPCGRGEKYVEDEEFLTSEIGLAQHHDEGEVGKLEESSASTMSGEPQQHEDSTKIDKSDRPQLAPINVDQEDDEESNPSRSPTAQKLRRKTPLADPFAESSAVQRLVEYFAVVSCKPHQNPARSTADSTPHSESRGEEEESPAEKSDQETVFRPQITARYPEKDHPDNPLNPMILQFCFPTGDEVVPVKAYRLPRIHYFVLTNDKGRKVYGICLTIMEDYEPPDAENEKGKAVLEDSTCSDGIEISVSQEKRTLFLPKVLVLLSTWPYLTAFREYLAQLYRLATATNVMTAPIERFIVNLCSEIPAPPPGSYEVQVSILDSTIRFWAPPAKLPIAYVALPYRILYECLDLEHVLDLFCALITEHKIVLVSSQYSILTICSEILCSLLFPMRWSHLYIPFLPKMLCPMLDAPVPYICGVVRENWDYAKEHLASDALVVDLDHNKVTLGPDTPTIPAPPQKKWNKLTSSLQQSLSLVFERAHGHDLDSSMEASKARRSNGTQSSMQQSSAVRETADGHQWREKLESWDHAFKLAYTPNSELMDAEDFVEISGYVGNDGQTQWDKVQEAFLRFFVAILKDYRRFLVIPSQSQGAAGRPSFNLAGFLESQPPHNVPFLEAMCMTQQFDDFITRRMYSPGEPELVFFDQSIDAKLNRSTLKIKKVKTSFLQNAKAHKILKKMKAIEPNEEKLSEFNFERFLDPYVYKSWPDTFDSKLFSRPRPIPKMISAEFDRQALLVSRLRIENVDEEDEEAAFFGGDYDKNPEVGAYTVFFFTYAALVGREWQEYKRRALDGESSASNLLSCDRRDNPEYVEQIETVLPNEVTHADADLCAQDLSFGVCTTCPDNSLKALNSTLVYVSGTSVEDVYSSFWREASERVSELQRQLSRANENSAGVEEAKIEMEEAREVAAAQLDLAFEVLKTVSMRKLPADMDAYKSLMEACGRVGDTHRARSLIDIMKKDGFVLDAGVLSYFVSAFAHEESEKCAADENENLDDAVQFERRRSRQDAYSSYLQKGLIALQEKEEDSRPWLMSGGGSVVSDQDQSDTQSLNSSRLSMDEGSVFDWIGQSPERLSIGRRRRRRRRLKFSNDKKITRMVSTQLELGRGLLEYLYPDLVIATDNQSCPHCSYVLSENEVVAGWSCSFDDFTTKCSKCSHRFVPHFSVSCSAPTFKGSQGPGSALFCEFLSPWVIRKALHQVIKGDAGIEGFLDPGWRSGTDIRATLYWNLIVLCQRYNLPFTFMLSGSVPGRTILPRMPEDM